MSEYSSAIDAVFGQYDKAAANLSTDKSPDDAARALELSNATGAPAESIAANQDEFEHWHKRILGQQILNQNSTLSDFVARNPIHGQLIHDDLGALDTLTKHLQTMSRPDPLSQGFKGFAERFGDDFGEATRKKIAEETPWLPENVQSQLRGYAMPIEFGQRVFAGVLGFAQGSLSGAAQNLGFSESAANKFANDMAGMLEYEMLKPREKVPEFALREGGTPSPGVSQFGEVLPPEGPPPAPGGLPAPPKTIEAEPVDLGRRGFLKGLGSATAATIVKPDLLKGMLELPPSPIAAATKRSFSPFAYNIAKRHLFGDFNEEGDLEEIPNEQALQTVEAIGRELQSRGNELRSALGGALQKGLPTEYQEAIDLIKSGWRPDMFEMMVERTAEQYRPFAEAGVKPPSQTNEVFDEYEQQQAQTNQQMLDKAMDHAEKTQLKERSPEKLEELLQYIPNLGVRIPTQALIKAWGPDIAEALEKVQPGISNRVMSPFGTVTLPTNSFVAHVPRDVYKSLADDIALGDGLSTNEAKEFQEIRQAPLQSKAKPITNPKDEAIGIGSEIAQHMVRLGRPEEEANRIGQLNAATYYARAVRLGISPRDLYEQDAIKFGQEGEGRSFEQPEEPPILPPWKEVGFEDYADYKQKTTEAEWRRRATLTPEQRELEDANIKKLIEHNNKLKELGLHPSQAGDERLGLDFGDKLAEEEFDKSIEEFSKPKKELTAKEKGEIKGIRVVKQGIRGRVTFNRPGATMEFFSSANPSTPVHEFGHFWVDNLFRDALRPGAPDAIVNSRDALLQALGRKPGEIIDSLAFTDKDHEQAATWFEQYLREGKAPSTKLADVFEKYKRDLTSIYLTAERLGESISDPVRQVFDKMLATDEEIRARTTDDSTALDSIRQGAGFKLNISGYPWVEDLPYQQSLVLSKMIQRKASWEEFLANPLIQEFMAKQLDMRKLAPTRDQVNDPEWIKGRTYVLNGKEYKGDSIVSALIDNIESSTSGGLGQDRLFTLVIGPPGAGKSTVQDPIIAATRSAAVNSDEFKNVIPSYAGGIGVEAAHNESVMLAIHVMERLMEKGVNIVHEKLGDNYQDIIPMLEKIKARGYRINLAHVHAPIEELAARIVNRFQQTGRIVDLKHANYVAAHTPAAYLEMKPYADEAASFDNTNFRAIPTDGANTTLAAIVGRANAERRGGSVQGSLPEASATGSQEAPIEAGVELPTITKRTFNQPEGAEPPFNRGGAFGRTQREYKRYQELIAKRDAEDVAWRRNRAEKEAKRENSAEWKKEEERLRPEVKQEVMTRPEVRAYSTLENTQVKFGRKHLTDEEKEMLPNKLMSVDGAHPDELANFFGFQTGHELIQLLAQMHEAAKGYKGDIIDRLTEAEIYRQTKEKVGPSAQDRLDEVTDHALSVTQMELLHEQTLALGQRMGLSLQLNKQQMQWGARELLMNDNFGGMRSSNYLREAGKASRKLERALLDNDPQEAFQQAQAQYINTEQAKEAVAIEREKKIFQRQVRRLRAREVKGYDAEYLNWIHDILMRVGEAVARTPEDLKREIAEGPSASLGEFLAGKLGMGREIYVPDFLVDPSYTMATSKKPLGNMTVREARQVMQAIRSLAKNARDEQTIVVQGDKKDVEEVLNKMAEELSQIEKSGIEKLLGTGPGQNYKWTGGPYTALRKGFRTFLAKTLQVEYLLNRWDHGNIFGLFSQAIGRPMFEAAAAESRLEKEIAKDYLALPNQLTRSQLRTRVPNVLFKDPQDAYNPKTGKYDWDNAEKLALTRRNLRAILLNAGNPDNLRRLTQGYGLKPDQIFSWLEDNATKEDWDWAQAHGDIFAKLKAQSDNMYRRISGIAPESVEILPIQTKHGIYRGWYHPIIHDPLMDGVLRAKGSADDLFPDVPGGYIRAGTAAGYTKTRTNYIGPLDLDLDGIPARLSQEIHDIAFREAVMNAAKIVYNPRFLNMITKYYGKEYSNLFKPWLKDAANAANVDTPNQAAFAKVMDWFRENTITSLIAFNLRTVEKHGPTAAVNSIAQVGLRNMLTATRSLYSTDPARGMSNWQWAMETFDELDRRHKSYLEQVRGAQFSALEGPSFRKGMQKAGTWLVAKSDLLSAVPTAIGAYTDAIEEGKSHGDAVYAGNAAVRMAHGSGAVTSRPEWMRQPGWLGRWVTSLYTFMNEIGNRRYKLMWQAKEAAGYIGKGEAEKGYKMLPDLMWGVFSTVIFVGIMENLVTPSTPDKPGKKKESWEWEWAKAGMHSLAATWPIARDVANALIEGKDPSVGMMDTSVKSLTDIARDLDKRAPFSKQQAGKTVKHAIVALGVCTGMAPSEFGNIAEFTTDLVNGKARPANLKDWYRGLTKGEAHPKEYRPDLVERALRVLEGGR
jgi:predicted ABC-type ATPase